MACLLALYERVYGPGADYFAHVSHNTLRSLFIATLADPQLKNLSGGFETEEPPEEEEDEAKAAGIIIRQLRDDGWLETYYDSANISEAYRFTRDGKVLTEAFMRIGRPTSHTRHRNMRGCRNALEAFLHTYDPHELVDAYECAQNVIEDLNENIGLIYEHARLLVQQAAQTSAWSEFDAFLKRFERDIRPQLTSEHVSRHRTEIRERCNEARRFAPEMMERIDQALDTLLPWAQEQRTARTTYMWVIERIEDMVDGACNAKQPELHRAVTEYTRRITGLLREVMAIRLLDPHASIDTLLKKLSEMRPEAIELALGDIGWLLSLSNVRLIDPASIRVTDSAARTKISTEIRRHQADPEARKRTAIAHALSGAFAMTDKEAVRQLEELTLSGPKRTSQFSVQDAMSLLLALHAPDIARSAQGANKFEVKRLSGTTKNRYFVAPEYLITRKPT